MTFGMGNLCKPLSNVLYNYATGLWQLAAGVKVLNF